MTRVSHNGLRFMSGGRAATAGLALALACAAAVLPARAENFPSITPTRDTAVTYNLDSTATGAMQVQAFASPAQQVLRVQLGTGSDYLLLDCGQERVMLVSPGKGLIFAVPSDGMLHRQLGPDSGLDFIRAGHRVVAGQDCTVWTVKGPGGHGEACVTHDGVVLEGAGEGNKPDDHGQIPSGRLIATNVSHAPLSPSLFAPPPGLQEVDLPPSLFRAMIPGLAGLPSQ